MFKEWLTKLKEKKKQVFERKKSPEETNALSKKQTLPLKDSEYPNRFLKFYHQISRRLNQERRTSYSERKKAGICVRCHKPVVPHLVFCEFHQQKQKGYNQKARAK